MVKKEFATEREARIAREKELESQNKLKITEPEEKVPASTRFLSKSDKLFEYAEKIKPIEGFEDIVVHGDPIGFSFRNSDGVESNVSVKEFADIIKNQNINNDKPIRLISCDAGSEGSIAEQGLADMLGVDVLAPTDIAYVDFEGNVTIGDNNTGKWVLFKPRRK